MDQHPEPQRERLLQILEEAVASTSKDPERILEYFDECQILHVEVLPPDINLSHGECALENDQDIRLGFSSLIGAHRSVIDAILEERRAHGEFHTFQEVCERLELTPLPAQFFCQCIEAGVFDSIVSSRASLFAGHEKIIKAVQKAKADRSSNQISLFDVLPASPTIQLAPIPLPDTDAWPKDEQIEHEKNALGFSFTEYATEHEQEDEENAVHPEETEEEKTPLTTDAEHAAIDETPEEPSVSEQEDAAEKEKTHPTADAEHAAIEKAPEEPSASKEEDAEEKETHLTADTEHTALKEALQESPASEEEAVSLPPAGPEIPKVREAEVPPLPPEEFTEEELEASFTQEESEAVNVSETLASQEEHPEEAIPPEEKSASTPQPDPTAFVIHLETPSATETTLRQIRDALQQHAGGTPVVLEICNASEPPKFIQTHREYWVRVSVELTDSIEQICGPNTTRIVTP